jgi:hypothetical protein
MPTSDENQKNRLILNKALSACAHQHLHQLTSLSQKELHKKLKLPCGCGKATLEELLVPYACPTCSETYFYSFCWEKIAAASKTWHCILCGQCRKSTNQRCPHCSEPLFDAEKETVRLTSERQAKVIYGIVPVTEFPQNKQSAGTDYGAGLAAHPRLANSQQYDGLIDAPNIKPQNNDNANLAENDAANELALTLAPGAKPQNAPSTAPKPKPI